MCDCEHRWEDQAEYNKEVLKCLKLIKEKLYKP